METPRKSRTQTLGKRTRAREQSPTPSCASTADTVLLTPDPTPDAKRVKTTPSLIIEEGHNNKENIPPLVMLSPESSPTRARSGIRRSSTEIMTPSRRSLMRRGSTSVIPATPSSQLATLSISTPPPTPPIFISMHARARALLRSTCNNADFAMSGRDAERDAIAAFINAFATGEETDSPTLYISGTPGTGKTALVNTVFRDTDMSDMHVFSVNCMALNTVDALWERLAEDMSSKPKGRGKKVTGRDAVTQALSASKSKWVVLLDELDHIAAANTLQPLFSLATAHADVLRIIGIANTHTLSAGSTFSAQGVQTLHFAPYTGDQLLAIVKSRLEPLFSPSEESLAKKLLPPTTLMLLSKKVAAQTGDVRAVFEVLRGAIDLAVAARPSPSSSMELDTPTVVTVTPSHILAALKSYAPSSATGARGVGPTAAGSEFVMKIRNLGLQARLVLLSLTLAFERLSHGLALSGSPVSTPVAKGRSSPLKRSQSSTSSGFTSAVDSTSLYSYYGALLRSTGNDLFAPVSRSEFGDLLGLLETAALVSLAGGAAQKSPTKAGFKRSASFAGGLGAKSKAQEVRWTEGMRVEEVRRGLGLDAAGPHEDGDAMQEEVARIYTREEAKIRKEARARGAVEKGDMFADAMED